MRILLLSAYICMFTCFQLRLLFVLFELVIVHLFYLNYICWLLSFLTLSKREKWLDDVLVLFPYVSFYMFVLAIFFVCYVSRGAITSSICFDIIKKGETEACIVLLLCF